MDAISQVRLQVYLAQCGGPLNFIFMVAAVAQAPRGQRGGPLPELLILSGVPKDPRESAFKIMEMNLPKSYSTVSAVPQQVIPSQKKLQQREITSITQ